MKYEVNKISSGIIYGNTYRCEDGNGFQRFYQVYSEWDLNINNWVPYTWLVTKDIYGNIIARDKINFVQWLDGLFYPYIVINGQIHYFTVDTKGCWSVLFDNFNCYWNQIKINSPKTIKKEITYQSSQSYESKGDIFNKAEEGIFNYLTEKQNEFDNSFFGKTLLDINHGRKVPFDQGIVAGAEVLDFIGKGYDTVTGVNFYKNTIEEPVIAFCKVGCQVVEKATNVLDQLDRTLNESKVFNNFADVVSGRKSISRVIDEGFRDFKKMF
ncbi:MULTISPECIES: hypothetical protein [Psychrilyobacter]|uniref:Uncharacterized protein n=1 Tax=Psychrilyobacter piezotolerans TaxID=2293438 RepID=A0ABX9KDH8_9FUSO|nr:MULTISPECIES: hypothetical protein [Psychrilyobacter]MCS5422429.1 hypothetical protein [Psychrilyobacter sp. S5]NDI79061.1 hypothetical protein [Psychrilyobacter piezotolerans]RDE59022.1 hypothetical protein DV867_14185 [Psychrilyobacter sp. S5]REI39599.1 hypothetical protein DYH56_14185 [Psychrilyobacter piezotolerans]